MGNISRGICAVCGKEFAKNVMTKHIAGCGERKPGAESRFHIVVQGLHQPEYWLHIAAHPRARLSDLDKFLRDIWLECCGHMSRFDIAGMEYLYAQAREFEARSMATPLGEVMRPGLNFTHTYDFGTPTELGLHVAGEIRLIPSKKKIHVLARNIAPGFVCGECGKLATQLCSECSWDSDAWFCDGCAMEHECGEEMMLPAVNSPRVGQCGYTG